MYRDDDVPLSHIITVIIIGLILLLGIIAGGMYGCARYEVWQQTLKGEGELKRAESNRRIKVYEAQAALESAKLQASAEIERAKGVAEANKIVADGLKGNDEYLRYLWIDKVAAGAQHEIIYVPTEAALPILEAGGRKGAGARAPEAGAGQ